MSESVLPMFSSKSFILSGLIFRSLIHFEFIYVYGVRECSNFILLHVAGRSLILNVLSLFQACKSYLFFKEDPEQTPPLVQNLKFPSPNESLTPLGSHREIYYSTEVILPYGKVLN